MDKIADTVTFRIRKRPWYVWLSRAVWILWLLLWLDFAIGSWQEREQSVFLIASEVLIISILFGLVLYFWRLRSSRNQEEAAQTEPAG